MKRWVSRILVFFVLSSTLALMTNDYEIVYAQSQDNVVLDLHRITWNHSTIRILVLTNEGASWWSSTFVDSMNRAISIWNEGLDFFASNHSDYAYVSEIELNPTFSDVELSGFDVYVSWTVEALDAGVDSVGLAVTYSVSGIVDNSSITLSVYNRYGIPLSEVELQNVAVHELGHSLGLNHCNSAGDIMYPSSLLGNPARGVSTLNVFGVASVFGWLSDPTRFNPSGGWPLVSHVGSPSDIEYGYLPLSSENVPPLSVLEPIIGPFRFVFEYILMFVPLEFLVLGLIVIIAVPLLWLILRPVKKRPSADARET